MVCRHLFLNTRKAIIESLVPKRIINRSEGAGGIGQEVPLHRLSIDKINELFEKLLLLCGIVIMINS
jgi:hypothetical protein